MCLLGSEGFSCFQCVNPQSDMYLEGQRESECKCFKNIQSPQRANSQNFLHGVIRISGGAENWVVSFLQKG